MSEQPVSSSPVINTGRNLPRARPTCARTVGDALLAAAAAWPDADALAFPQERISYATLLQRSWRTALSMSALGIEPGDHVGLFMQNSVEFVTTFFAIGMLGGCAVPVNVRYRGDELRFVIRDSDLRLIVTHDRYASYADLPDVLAQCLPGLAGAQNARKLELPGFPKLRCVVSYGTTKRDGVVSQAELQELASQADGARVAKWCDSVALRSTAAIIYTSGTTSRPRGAMLSHEALAGGWASVAQRWTVRQEDRFWVPVPLFHIAALGPLMAVVSRGACFVSDGWFDAQRAIVQIERERATMLYTVYPPITQSMIAHPGFSTADFSSVRWWLNVAPPDTLREMARALPRAIQVTTYGGTEGGPVTIGAPDEDEQARLNTCGRPMTGLEVRIVDTHSGAELPAGAAGEILYRGYPTFSGYYRDAHETSASLDRQGWFHSGDLGQLDGEGRLIYLGRIKEMLKIGGENVAPAEIEALLATHPAVKLVQVVGIPDSRLVEVPAAFVELHQGHTVEASALIDFCRGRIASFKVPRHIRFIAQWPMSATKIQRNVLKERLQKELGAGVVE